MYTALILEQHDGKTQASIGNITDAQLPAGNVTVKVSHSSLNYKDGLAITGTGKIIRQFPMVPGIDFAGEVLSSADKRYQVGDKVILTGWGVGETHWGGMAEVARVDADWLVPMPANCDAAKAMMIGTAGLTAMLCVQAILDANIPTDTGEILVTGASGGVGSTAVRLLSQLGYQVCASSGRVEQNHQLLTQLGATSVIERAELDRPAKPLEKQRWAAVVDSVGNQVLATALSQIHYGGVAAICGLAGGAALPTTVMPFILRGVNLLGIDSVNCPLPRRQQAWQSLMQLLPDSFYQQACTTIELAQVPEYAARIIKGEVTGRTLVKL
ncbi:oxidoreductase [Shewanella sp. C32]|uniref:Oxidoreductase n=1 Tax=Shewanella electrica TaxID=515560 RepID=A0ABT2FRP8_9GAMM|nr:MDR family oxidoreductase [Shewanella electrica]MCH1926996.1 oxidoreductase [Shewanella electrica]MCS4558617.1 oxidoreductase [Shewanella electrica]